MAKKNKDVFDYPFINNFTKLRTVRTYIPCEAYGFKIHVNFTNEEVELNKLYNKLSKEQKEQLADGLDPQDLSNLQYFLDYYYYTVDNDLKKYEIIITQKPEDSELKDIFCLASDLVDEILYKKGYDIPANSADDNKQLRNELASYIGQEIWDFCKNKI